MAGFEKGFMLGAATAAHQVEGNNVNSDMWAMEHMKSSGFSELSLDAVDHYHRYEEDIALMAEAGLNAYRFSIEWARIEPAEGVFDASEMAHYEEVIACCRSLIGPDGQLPNPEGAELTQMEYEFYPEALGNVLRKAAEDFHGELIVTENGIATADDRRRVEFIRRALAGVQQCIADGLPVKGYMYWSLLDNFEWQKGYAMTFGLIAVDRSTQTRYPKESLAYLGSFAGKRKGDAASAGCGAAAG